MEYLIQLVRWLCNIFDNIVYWLMARIYNLLNQIAGINIFDAGDGKSLISTISSNIYILIGVVMSVVLTLIPHLIGFGEFVDSGKRYKYLWQFAYEFLYCIFLNVPYSI